MITGSRYGKKDNIEKNTMKQEQSSLERGYDAIAFKKKLGKYTKKALADQKQELSKKFTELLMEKQDNILELNKQLADQKTKMIQIINNTKLCVSGITAQREFRSSLLKDFEELK